MTGLKDTLARLARLQSHSDKARDLPAPADWTGMTGQAKPRPSGLTEITGFGTNPGKLRLHAYVPAKLSPAPPLVVALHGCTQSALAYDHGSGWSELAKRHGFAVLYPEQQTDNNPNRCFNWFLADDTRRESGEAQSIHQMIGHMMARHGIDPARVFIVGLSAGGAMTAVMLAAYPETFAAGAIIAGLPYGSASSVGEALESMGRGRPRPPEAWGDLVRAASPARKVWPKLSVWHGSADTIVNRANAEESLKQWTNTHGLKLEPDSDETVVGYRRRAWRDSSGAELIEAYTISGLGHGVPISLANETDAVGNASAYHFDVGISSTLEIARFWGLAESTKPNWRERLVCATTKPVQSAPELATLPLAAFGALPDRFASVQQKVREEARHMPVPSPDPLAVITASLKQAGLIVPPAAYDEEAKNRRFDPRALISSTLRSVGLLKE